MYWKVILKWVLWQCDVKVLSGFREVRTGLSGVLL